MCIQSQFLPHGKYSLQIQNGIILINARGAWNLEGKMSLMDELFSSIKLTNQKYFSMLVDVSEFELGTPDFQALGVIEKTKLIELGLRKTAYVNSVKRTSHIQQIASMQPHSSQYQWRIFNSYYAAQRWLADESLNNLFKLS